MYFHVFHTHRARCLHIVFVSLWTRIHFGWVGGGGGGWAVRLNRNPVPETSKLLNIKWPSYRTDDEQLLNIDYNLTIERINRAASHVQLWAAIYKCLYQLDCDHVAKYLDGAIRLE